MSIQLAKLADSECLFLTACAQLKDPSAAQAEIIRVDRDLTGKAGAGSSQLFLHVGTGGSRNAHLHLDLAQAKYFLNRRKPRKNCEMAECTDLIGKLSGVAVDVAVTGVFDVPFDRLPESGLIHTLTAKEGTGAASIRLVGATLALKGMPLSSVSWRLSRDEKTARVTSKASREDKIDDNYLQRLLDWISGLHSLLVLGITRDARA